MKRLTTSSALTLLALSSAPAFAQSASSSGFTPYGSVSLNYIDFEGVDNETYALADGGFSWDFGGNWGVDYGILGLATDGNSEAAHYLALAYNFGNARVSVGAPAPAFSRYGEFRLERQVPLYGLELSILTGSLVNYIDLLGGSDNHSYGLRFDSSTASGLTYAVSLHGFHDISDVYALSSSAMYDAGSDLVITGGLEYVDGIGDSVTKAKFGVQKGFGQFSVALNAAYADGFISSDSITYYELSGQYDFNDKFSIGASLLGTSQNSETLAGLDASYRFYDNASLTAAVLQNTGSSSDAIYNIGVRYDF